MKHDALYWILQRKVFSQIFVSVNVEVLCALNFTLKDDAIQASLLSHFTLYHQLLISKRMYPLYSLVIKLIPYFRPLK